MNCTNYDIPVVIIADLIIDELHSGCTDLMNATAPATCGQAMEVPDVMLKNDGLVEVKVSSGIVAARIATPGAIMSGYNSQTSTIIHDM